MSDAAEECYSTRIGIICRVSSEISTVKTSGSRVPGGFSEDMSAAGHLPLSGRMYQNRKCRIENLG